MRRDSAWPASGSTYFSLGHRAAAYTSSSMAKGTKASFPPWMNSIGVRECATCAAALASRKEKPARRRSSASAVYSTGNGGRP